MGAVRYNSTFYSDYGTEWKIEIYDKDSSVASPTSFKTYGDGFTLSYEGSDEETYKPIIGSAVKIYFAVEDSDGETLINDILTSQEKRFFIMIYKGGSFYWGGILLQDLGTVIDEALPSQVTLSAIDGIGYLKDFSYGYPEYNEEEELQGAVFQNEGYQTCLKHLALIFNGMFAILDNAPYPSFNNLLSTAVTFYEDNMHSGTIPDSLDPLEKTRINHNAFIELGKNLNENSKGVTYYEVLEQICLIFNARFFLSDGKWRLYNINQYQSTSFRERTYNYDASLGNENFTLASNSALVINKAINQSTYATLSNPSRTFYPNIVYAKRKFSKEGSTNLLPQQDNFEPNSNNDYYNSSISIDSSGTSDYKITLTGNGYIAINNTGSVSENNATFLLKGVFYISDGSTIKYLTNDIQNNNNTDWTTSFKHFYITCQPTFIEENSYQQLNFDFNFTSDNINIDIENYYFALDGFGFWTGANFSAFPNGFSGFGGGNISAFYFLNYIEANLLYNGIVQPDPVEVDFYGWNPNAFLNEKKLIIADSLIGDDTSANSYGKLQILNTSGSYVDSSSWKVNGSGDADKIINLQLKQITKLRLEPVPKLNVQIKGDIDFYNKITYDSSEWIPLSMTINASSGIIDFQLFKIDEISGDVSLLEENKNQLPKPPTNTTNILKTLNNKALELQYKGYNFIGSTSNNTKTEVFVNNVSNKRANLTRNQVANFKAYAVGVLTSGSDKGDVIALEQFGCIKNIDETCSIVGTTTSTQKADSGIGGSVGLSIEPDSTNQSIKVSVTGDASESIEWKINLDLTITTFADAMSLIFEDGNNIITEASDNLTTENI